ncbi:glycosyltransferase family A protein [Mangrovimonas sp. YM274]|uniref:glycosyltransferase family 2 protein n=1 Tax=Mangrovimonas sp. YM274 TaxID=3070660 RepID=UPI0027DCA126|nr:glycosyltransferase family A protein [Mangrovimonas sp. YM274]WMI69840.1 glycosyltransferase family A protein [Mangrovimonas sp. YM274]
MKVSVIVPCYNQAEYLNQALQSVLEQTYQNWECIIVNDGATDHTESQSKLWTSKDVRFRYFSKTNGGLSSARNFGIERANGSYILPLDADDYLSANYIESCVEEIEGNRAKLVYGRVERFGIKTGEWKLKPFHYYGLFVANMVYCSAMFHKEDWKKVGGYDETMLKGLEDWEFWIHILNKEDKVVKLDSITFFYRIKEFSMTSLMDKKTELEVKSYVFKKHASKYFDAFVYLADVNKTLERSFLKPSFVFRRLIKLMLGIKK